MCTHILLEYGFTVQGAYKFKAVNMVFALSTQCVFYSSETLSESCTYLLVLPLRQLVPLVMSKVNGPVSV